MNHTFLSGNIFDSKCAALVDAVNTVGVKGAGLALQFKQRFPESYNQYRQYCFDGKMRPGEVLISQEKNIFVIHFPTKQDWRDPSQLEWIERGLGNLIAQVNSRQIPSIAIPSLGCGLGGLNWSDVRPLIVAACGEMPECRVEIFGAAASASKPNLRK